MESECSLIPGLPNDIAVTCIARVSVCFYPHIRLVCRAWLRLIKSSAPLVEARRRTKKKEHHVYIAVRCARQSNYAWYVLPGEYSRRECVRVPPMPITTAHHSTTTTTMMMGSAFAALGSLLFVIGGSINGVPSSRVWVFDALSGSWSSAPNMTVPREFATASALNGLLYVAGGCIPSTFCTSWAEVYDPCSQVWKSIPSPPEICAKWMQGSVVLGGRFLALSNSGGVMYDPAKQSWSSVSAQLQSEWKSRSAVVDGILYSYGVLGNIKSYDPCTNKWLELQGVVEHLPKFLYGAALVNVGECLYALWERESVNKSQVDLVCAALHVNKELDSSVSVQILWSKVVLSLPRGSATIHCLSLDI